MRAFLRVSVIAQILIGLSLVVWDWELEPYQPYLVAIFFGLPVIHLILYKSGTYKATE